MCCVRCSIPGTIYRVKEFCDDDDNGGKQNRHNSTRSRKRVIWMGPKSLNQICKRCFHLFHLFMLIYTHTHTLNNVEMHTRPSIFPCLLSFFFSFFSPLFFASAVFCVHFVIQIIHISLWIHYSPHRMNL